MTVTVSGIGAPRVGPLRRRHHGRKLSPKWQPFRHNMCQICQTQLPAVMAFCEAHGIYARMAQSPKDLEPRYSNLAPDAIGSWAYDVAPRTPARRGSAPLLWELNQNLASDFMQDPCGSGIKN